MSKKSKWVDFATRFVSFFRNSCTVLLIDNKGHNLQALMEPRTISLHSSRVGYAVKA